jgi:proliferating cell nuclear antigen
MADEQFLQNNILTVQTVQIQAFRTLVTALKDILIEANIVFKKDGIRIINMDKSHTILVHLYLDAQSFECYRCDEEKIIIGVNMIHFFKLINSIDNNETLTLYIEKSDYNDGIISELGLKFEDAEIKQVKTQKLRLIEPDPEEMEIPDVKFSSIINFVASDFQKIIRDLTGLSDKVEIKSVADELIFKCTGPFSSTEIRRKELDGSMEFQLKPSSTNIIQGEFSLKNLGYFIKCTNLCEYIEIFLENDVPLVVKYNVATLGEIQLCLAPIPSST